MLRTALRTYLFVTGLALLFCSFGLAEDWPTRAHDNYRSGVSGGTLSLPLGLVWEYTPASPPAPAWTESPAVHDYYHGWYNLKPRQNFDFCFDVAVVDGKVYFGSSTTGEIICLSLADGQRLWRFFTDGPVRFAPSLWDGKLYAGSDDGVMYCLDAVTGAQIWSERIGADQRIWGNEQVISVWPVRSSALVQDGAVYWAAGLFPEEGMYLCCRNAGDGTGGWTLEVALPPQGYLLATRNLLLVPSGKTYPMVFGLADGRFCECLRHTSRDGGAWGIVLGSGEQLVSGPTVEGHANIYDSETREFIAAVDEANYLISDGRAVYFNSNTHLTKMGRIRKAELWRIEESYPYAIIMDQSSLYAGGDGGFAVFDKTDGKKLWSAAVTGKVYGLAISDGCLLVSTDEGKVYCYRSH